MLSSYIYYHRHVISTCKYFFFQNVYENFVKSKQKNATKVRLAGVNSKVSLLSVAIMYNSIRTTENLTKQFREG